jgi:hypothetical protein
MNLLFAVTEQGQQFLNGLFIGIILGITSAGSSPCSQ